MADELISRRAALTWMDLLIEDSRKIAGKDKLILRVCDIQQGMRDMVAKLPAIDPASLRPRGEWIKTDDGEWMCTHCKEEVSICDCGKDRTYRKPFCPNCGADMRRTEGENV